MRRRIYPMVMCVLPVLVAPAWGQKAPEVVVEVDRPRIDLGESIQYRVLVNNVDRPAKPVLSEAPGVEIEFLGETQESFTSIISYNGRVIDNSRRGFRYTYRLTPSMAGSLKLPPPKVEIDGKELLGKQVTITVRPPSEQNLVFAELSCDQKTVYPTQSFAVTLRIWIKSLPEPYSHKDPAGFDAVVRSLNLPWADDTRLAEGLKPVRKLDEWLRPLIRSSGAGFRINDLATDTGAIFFGERALHFGLSSRRVTRRDAAGKAGDYWEYLLSRQFIAQRPGSFDFGPATVRGEFVAAVEDERLRFDEVRAVSNRLRVHVKEVPTAGRPAWFTGAIGRIDSRAELTPRQAKVGDPLKLQLTVRGAGVQETGTPNLADIPGIKGKFRVYDGSAATAGNERTFTYSVRPTSPDIKEFPSVPLAYFDVQSEQYVTVETPALPLKVSPADGLSGGDVANFTPRTPTAPIDASSPTGLRANTRDPDLFRDRTVQALWAAIAVAVALSSALGAGIFRALRSRWSTANAASAVDPLDEARQLLNAATGGVRSEILDEALKVDRAMRLLFDSMGADDPGKCGGEWARTSGVDADLIVQALEWQRELEAKRFGGVALVQAANVDAGRRLAQRLLEAVQSGKRCR